MAQLCTVCREPAPDDDPIREYVSGNLVVTHYFCGECCRNDFVAFEVRPDDPPAPSLDPATHQGFMDTQAHFEFYDDPTPMTADRPITINITTRRNHDDDDEGAMLRRWLAGGWSPDDIYTGRG